MTVAAHSTEAARERAALYALGALEDEEAREFERHVEGGCDQCAAELRVCATAAAVLAPPHATPPSLRARVLERIASERQTAQSPASGLVFARSAQLAWQPGAGSAIAGKLLFRDAQRGYRTQLVRMEAGASYPAHRHADVEELYVLEGDLWVSGVLMQPGDYCRAEAGTTHSGISTQNGCVFLALASERNQPLP